MKAAGIKIGKVQISAAVKVALPDSVRRANPQIADRLEAVKFSKYEVQQVLTFVILRERSEEESGRAPLKIQQNTVILCLPRSFVAVAPSG